MPGERRGTPSLLEGGVVPLDFDRHLTNHSLWQADDGRVEINVGLRAVSRFYCNLDIRIIVHAEGETEAEAIESCD